ncbi:DoxX family protein [Paludibacter sp.]
MKKKSSRKSKYSSSNLIDKNQVVLHILRLILACVFIFSGTVKAIDPLGTVYKIEDYLIAFDGFFVNLTFAAFPFAILLITTEILIGLSLLFQVYFNFFSWATLVFMLIITPLTYYVAVNNPVTDCGCFGDAIKISNWTTFYKNMILLVLAIALLIFNNRFRKIFVPSVELVMVILFIATSIGFMIYNLTHLPVIDFRPYKVGVNIPDAMSIPADAPTDQYEYNFVYEKEGIRKNFGINELPDSTWKFVSQETKLIKEGYKPPIHDFAILTSNFDDVTDEVLSYSGKSVIIVMYDLGKTSESGIYKVKDYIAKLVPSIKVFALTASTSTEIQEFKNKYKIAFPFYKTDPITLKTIIRANPGVVVIQNGTILEKYNGARLSQ